MTPVQVARAALRLSDALDVVADEMGREDACQEIITHHSDCAAGLARDLSAIPDAYAAGGAGYIVEVLESDRGPSIADLTRWADAWRTWGEARRAEVKP